MTTISIAKTDRDILRCFPVMVQLRPHLVEGQFVERIRRQQRDAGYVLAFLAARSRARCVAGFRVSECLATGRYLYVDDLVTHEADRSNGYGEAMYDWLLERARYHHCEVLSLDSGVQRFGAHRFYLNHRMDIVSHHFARKLK